MRLDIGPFSAIDWSEVPAIDHAGETGVATWRTVQKNDVRIRMVEYSPGYVADHWCEKGHVIHVAKGELMTELRDEETYSLHEGRVTGLVIRRARTDQRPPPERPCSSLIDSPETYVKNQP